MSDDDGFTIYTPWGFIHSDEFTTDIIIEEVQEVYSTGPAIAEDGSEVTQQEVGDVQYYSYTKEDQDHHRHDQTKTTDEDEVDIAEDDIHEEKFILRFLATNTSNEDRYLWVTDDGEVRSDGSYTNIATFFEVIHWCSPHLNNYQLICWGGACKGHILYMDGTSLKSRTYHASTDDNDITTKFQMSPRGSDITVRAFISKTGVPIYFDSEGNYRPEGPPRQSNSSVESEGEMQPLYFITANVKLMKVTSV